MAQDYRVTVTDWIRQATTAEDAEEFAQTGIAVLSVTPFAEAIILAHPPENSEVFVLAIQVDALDANAHPTLLRNVLQLNCEPDLLPGAFALEPQEQIVLYRWTVDLPGMDDTTFQNVLGNFAVTADKALDAYRSALPIETEPAATADVAEPAGLPHGALRA